MNWRNLFPGLIADPNHQVATLGDYVRYKKDPNRFHNSYPGKNLSFDCERIRDDFVKLTQSIISPELSISAETMVWRQGRALYLADSSVSGKSFAAWKNQVANLATIQHPPQASHYGTLLQSLFTSVIIHGGNAGEQFSIEIKRESKLDACG